MKIKRANGGIPPTFICLILILTLLTAGVGMAAAADPIVSIKPAVKKVNVSDDFSVFIEVDPNGHAVETALLNLTYDPTKVSITDVVLNGVDFPFNDRGDATVAGQITNIAGVNTAITGLTTVANLAEIQIHANAAGTFTVGISGNLTKPPGDPLIPVTMNTGEVRIKIPGEPLEVSVLHPNGGESIPIGTQVQVSAHATDDLAVTSVTFSYSNNSGSDWNSIGAGTRFSGTAKDGIWNGTWNTNSLGAGSNYLIRAVADDGTSTREDPSDSTFSLTCIPPSAPALNDPGTTDTDGSYTVSWSSVSGATSYTLEEDTSGSFGSPTVVYSGSSTSKYIAGRSDGAYYYRVKACNACGCSGLSNVEDIEVTVEGLPKTGDLNDDGILTPADATITLQLAASRGWHLAADVNGDGSVTSLDALMILMMAQKTQVCVNASEVVSGAFDVTIDIHNVVDLDSGQFDLTFDSSVVNVIGVNAGNIGGTPIPIDGWCFMDADTIRIVFNFGAVDGVSGSGYVAKIDFERTGSQGDTSILDISEGVLVDTCANEIPAIWIDGEVTIGEPTPTSTAPDLVVESITTNCGYLFGNESNEVSATIVNNGGDCGNSFNVSFVLSGGFSAVESVDALASGNSTMVSVVDPTISNAGDSVTITVIADCDGEIAEDDESNNAAVQTETVANNGYKGKTYTGGGKMPTWKTFDLNGDLVYSAGDSYYLSMGNDRHWATYDVCWAAGDLPVPATATVAEARLYALYTWDKASVMPDEVSMSFNGVVQTRDAHYSDEKMHGTSYSYPYGMLAYNITDNFNAGGNIANLTNSHSGGGNVSMRGMMLLVVYEDGNEPRRQIFLNEGFDLLCGKSSKCTTSEEATAWAPITGLAIDPSIVASARLITFAPGADPNEGELIFNGHIWTDEWNDNGLHQIGISDRAVTRYFKSTDNEVGFRSSDDYMEASNAILVLEEGDRDP